MIKHFLRRIMPDNFRWSLCIKNCCTKRNEFAGLQSGAEFIFKAKSFNIRFRVQMFKISDTAHKNSDLTLYKKTFWQKKVHTNQETLYRNAQLRYTQIVYWTLWEECKQTQCPHRSWRERATALMWYITVQQKNKLIYQANTYDFWISGHIWKIQ